MFTFKVNVPHRKHLQKCNFMKLYRGIALLGCCDVLDVLYLSGIPFAVAVHLQQLRADSG